MRRVPLGKQLTRLRTQRGISQAQLARISGVSQTYVNSLELGKQKNPGIETLRKLATALGVPVTALLE
jgi:transcriptional regulator with XRE-family HTH domain